MSHLDLDAIQRFLRARQTEQEREATLEHLRECPTCRMAVREEQRFSRLLALADDPLEGLDATPTQRRVVAELRGPRRARFGLLSAALLATVGGYLGGRLWPVSEAVEAPSAANPRLRALEIEFVRSRADYDYYLKHRKLVDDIEFLESLQRLLHDAQAAESP